MTYRERQRLADIQAAIDAIRSHLQRGGGRRRARGRRGWPDSLAAVRMTARRLAGAGCRVAEAELIGLAEEIAPG